LTKWITPDNLKFAKEGCMKNKTYHPRGKKIHGYRAAEHPSYVAWANMKSRCNNPNDVGYENYGGRGITYCKEWEHFENFAMAMGLKPAPDYTLERVDNDKGYEPGNCIWATRHVQAMNRRTFRNNTSGERGVTFNKRTGRYIAQVNHKGQRYKAGGTFETPVEARFVYEQILTGLIAGKDVSSLLERPARYDSATGIKGITPHKDGGYVVRTTKGGERLYLGYFKTFDAARGALENAER